MWGLVLTGGWAWWKAKGQRRRWVIPAACLCMVFCQSLPLTVWLGSHVFEDRFPTRPTEPVQTIIVLGGDVIPTGDATRPYRLGPTSLARTLATAELVSEVEASVRVLVSGGPSAGEPAAAAPAMLMAELLFKLGIPREQVVIEDRSRTTVENARESARLISELSLRSPVLLVTSEAHLPRAVATFEKAGIAVVAVGCDRQREQLPSGLGLLWPRATALSANQMYLREGVAWLVYWSRGDL
jgi:uncharacterized SAM-binding protein YcdF (DUF218 family)